VEEKFEEMGETGSVQQVQESLRLLSQKKKKKRKNNKPSKKKPCMRERTYMLHKYTQQPAIEPLPI